MNVTGFLQCERKRTGRLPGTVAVCGSEDACLRLQRNSPIFSNPHFPRTPGVPAADRAECAWTKQGEA